MTMFLICSTLTVRPWPWTSSILRPHGDAPAADVAVVLLDGLHNLVKRQAVLDQPSGSMRTWYCFS